MTISYDNLARSLHGVAHCGLNYAPHKKMGIYVVANTRNFGFSGLASALVASCIMFGLSAGSAMATTVTASSYTLPNGTTTVQIYDSIKAPEGSAPGTTTVTVGTIQLQTSIGALNTYCVDLFDYVSPPTTYNLNALSTSGTYYNGSTTLNWTQAQVNTITALLTNGTLQTQNLVNTTALQMAIWEVEYDTAASNGSYNLTSTSPPDFYFTASGDSNSAAALAQAQTYLNNATGYLSGATWVGPTWLTNSSHFVEYLTGTGVQNLIYLATPEPSTLAVFGMALAGLWAARRRKLI
jgi:hypothetical protein